MIAYSKIVSELQSSKLTDLEERILSKLEELTDAQISSQLPNSLTVNIQEKIIEEKLSLLGMWRKSIVRKAWIGLYERGGWKVQYDSDLPGYYLSGKN